MTPSTMENATTANEMCPMPVWFAVHTRSQHEKAVDLRLRSKGICTYLPTVRKVHRWSDRRKTIDSPLLNCYVFVKVAPNNEERQRVLRTDSVLALVGGQGMGSPISEQEIASIRTIAENCLPFSEHPFLKVGQRVRVRGGAMDGLEGIFLSHDGSRRLVVSIEAMQRSLAVQLEGYEIEPA